MAADKKQGVGNIFYDPDAGTVLGRTGCSWLKILTFYVIYYSLLGVLFYGTVVLWQNKSTDITTVDGRTKGVATPYIRSRTDQPGMAVHPHNNLIQDEENQELELTAGEYIAEMEKFFTRGKYTKAALIEIFGEDFVTVSLGYLDFEGDDGLAKINKKNFEALVFPAGKTKTPFIFVTLNKVIGFKIQSIPALVNDEKPLNGVPMQDAAYYSNAGASDPVGVHPKASAAYFNCFPLDQKAKSPNTFLKEDSDFKVNAIYPYIEQKNYEWGGYKKEENKAYYKPFAILQVVQRTDTPNNKTVLSYSKQSMFRCNTVAQNIQYPYLGNQATVTDLKDGQGSFTFGFKG